MPDLIASMSEPLRASRSERDLRLDVGLVLGRDLVAEVLERPLGLEGQLLRLVARLDLLAPLLVLLGVLLGVADHLVDVVLGQHRRGRDPDLLLLAGRPVLGLHVEDAVGVDVERHLDLRDAARRRRDAVEDEPAERLVVGREVALALEDVDLDLVWLSDAVENTCDFDVGMVVLRSISLVMTPPSVSMPSDSGVTSSSRTSLTSPPSTPAWIAAPIATTSSGLTPLWGSLPPNSVLTAS